MIAGLPYDAEVDYIESTGTQWIDTGEKANQDTRAETRAAWVETGYDKAVFETDNGSTFNGGFGLQNTQAVVIRFIRGTQYIDKQRAVVAGTFYTMSVGPEGLTVDGSTLAIGSTADFQTNLTVPIFAWKRGATVTCLKVKVSYFKMWQGATLVLDMIPVRFTNDLGQSEGAMYDRVSRKLFRNAGTGAFIRGPDVATPVMGLHFMPRPKYTAKSYIRDGLIAMWDGIENAGWGVHDSNATVWKDLVGSDDLVPRGQNGVSVEGRYSFDEKCVTTFGYCGFPTSVGAGLTQCTVECVASVSALQSNPASVIGSYAYETGHLCLRTDGTYNNGGITIGYNTAGQLVWYAQSPWSRITGSTAYNMEEKAYFAVVFFGGNTYAQAYRNEELFTANQPSYIAKTGDNFCISGTWSKVGETLSGSFYSVRVHNRALSTSEIAANYAVDKERFNLP